MTEKKGASGMGDSSFEDDQNEPAGVGDSASAQTGDAKKKSRKRRRRPKKTAEKERKSEVFDQSGSKPVDQPFGQPVDQPFGQPVDQPFGQPVDQPVDQPVSQPVDQPVDQAALAPDGSPLPPVEYEHRYGGRVGIDQSEGEAPEPLRGISGGFDGGTPFASPEPVLPIQDEAATPFSAPTLPDAPSPLEETALNDKPLDDVGSTSSMPFEAPGTEKEESKVVEDKETNEAIDMKVDDNKGGSKEPAHKEINFEEGATMKDEQKDPLTTHPGSGELGGLEKVDGPEMAADTGLPSAPAKVEVTDVTSGEGSLDESTGFWQMLEEAGVTKQLVYMIAGILGVIIVIVLFFVFGGVGWVSDLISGDEIVDEVEVSVEDEEKVVVPEDQEEKGAAAPIVPADFDQRFGLSGLINSYIFGLEFSQQRILPGLDLNPVSGGSTVGIDLSLIAGQSQGFTKDTIVSYIDLLRQIDNVRRVDLYKYLNQYVDRRTALQEYLNVLNTLMLEVDSAKNVVLQEMARIDAEYTAAGEEKDLYEDSFFNSISALEGESSYNYLELFVEAGQKRVKQKAYYNTLKTINDSFDAAVATLAPRIQDISINSDALIQGVKVFEVTGSNIDAIIIE